MRKTSEEVKDMCQDHWGYTDKILDYSEIREDQWREFAGYLYAAAMFHGYKHGVADMEAERRAEIES